MVIFGIRKHNLKKIGGKWARDQQRGRKWRELFKGGGVEEKIHECPQKKMGAVKRLGKCCDTVLFKNQKVWSNTDMGCGKRSQKNGQRSQTQDPP